MYTHILVPIDGSSLSLSAARQAIGMAKLCKAKMSVILVSRSYRQLHEEGFISPVVNTIRERWEEEAGARAKEITDTVCADAAKAGVECTSLHAFNDAPYEAIVEAANKNGCDMIVMGSHGYGGVKQFLVGSETTRVLSHTKIPVLVYR